MADTAQEPFPPAPHVPEAPRGLSFRNSVPDWAIRSVVFLVFLFFGTAKFKSDAGAPWVVLFDQVGLGQWLRYFTGVIETGGAFLVLVSATGEVGLAILIVNTFAATIITIFVLHKAADAFIPFALFSGMIAFWLHRRRV